MRFTKILLVNDDGIVGSTLSEVPREHGCFECVFRIVESNEDLVAAMGILLDCTSLPMLANQSANESSAVRSCHGTDE
jgi:hypothetical protein